MGKCAFGAYADSEGPDQTAQPRSLIRAFAFRLQKYLIPNIILTNTESSDRAVRVCSLTRPFLLVYISELPFSTAWLSFMPDMKSQNAVFYRILHTYSDRQAWANSVDPDQTPRSAASDQGLHCLSLIQHFYTHLPGGKIDLF